MGSPRGWVLGRADSDPTVASESEAAWLVKTGARPDITVVLPFYNPGASALRETVWRSAETLSRTGVTFEIIAVDDGSTAAPTRSKAC